MLKPYVIVTGVLQSLTASVVNSNPADFLTKLFLDLSASQSHIAIVGGDFNCLLNPIIDRLSSKVIPLSPLAKALSSVCEERGYINVFLTAPHGCHGRIDYAFLFFCQGSLKEGLCPALLAVF